MILSFFEDVKVAHNKKFGNNNSANLRLYPVNFVCESRTSTDMAAIVTKSILLQPSRGVPNKN
jgi:hypothetical protein